MSRKSFLLFAIYLGLQLLCCPIQIVVGEKLAEIIVQYELYSKVGKVPTSCLPKKHWNSSDPIALYDSSSPIPRTLVLNDSILLDNQVLQISCISSQPLEWILDVPRVSLPKIASYFLNPEQAKGPAENRFHNCITFANLTHLSGPVRCESALNRTLGADMFIENDSKNLSEVIRGRSISSEEPNTILGNCLEANSKKTLLRNIKGNVVPCKVKDWTGSSSEPSFQVQLFEITAPESENHTGTLILPVLGNESNYDPRVGFHLKRPLKPNSTYRCVNGHNSNDCIDFVTVSEKEDKIPAKIEFINGNDGDETKGRLRCSVDEESKAHGLNLGLELISCDKVSNCLKRNVAGFYQPYAYDADRKTKCENSRDSDRTRCEIPVTQLQGLVYCHANSGYFGNRKYVENFDYFFKGYLLFTNGVSSKAVMTLTKENAEESGFAYRFLCKASVTLLFPYFNITLGFGSGMTFSHYVHPKSNDYKVPDRAGLYKISNASYQGFPALLNVHIDVWSKDLTLINCSAPFTHNMSWATETMVFDDGSLSDLSPTELVVIAVVFGFVAMLAVAAAVVFFWRFRKNQVSTRGLTNAEIEQFRYGNPVGNVYASNAAIHLTTLDSSGLMNVKALAFPAQFQIPWNDLEIYMNEQLGEGQSAACFRGKFNGTTVAVKMLKSNVQTEDFKNYLNEVKLMAYIGQHPNIIQFYGAVIEKLEQKIAPAVVEMSPYGNLQRFLQEQERQRLAAGNEKTSLADRDLISFCAQIASGMEYLSHRHVIHGDLAARNVLLFEGLTVKITDFGLSKNLYESSFYSRKHQQLQLPWRWMSPEALKYLMFSVQSDVWSFGVTAWEIFTMGQVPFAGLSWTTDFMRQLADEGLRLHKPQRATDKIYNFLTLCWTISSSDRPPFSEIKCFFLRLLSSDYEFAPV